MTSVSFDPSHEHSHSQQPNQSRDFFLDKLIQKGEVFPETISNASIKKTIYIGFAVLVWITGLNASPIFVSEAYNDLGYTSLRYITLLVFNAVLSVFMLIVPPFMQRWSYKNGLFIGSFGSLFMVLAGSLTEACVSDSSYFWCTDNWIYPINILFSAIFGVIASVFWLSFNRYINGCTVETNKGQYFGVASGLIFASRISRTALVIYGPHQDANFYLIPAGLVVVSIILFFIAPRVPKYREEEVTGTLKEETRKMLRMIWSTRIKPLLLFFFVVGMLEAYTEVEVRINLESVSDPSDTSFSVIPMLQGLIGAIASYVAGKLADTISTKAVLAIFNTFSVFAVLISLFGYLWQNLALCYLTGVLTGIGYGRGLMLVFLIMAKDFKAIITCFAAAQSIYSFGTLVGVCFSFMTNYIPFISVMLALLVVNQIVINFYSSKV